MKYLNIFLLSFLISLATVSSYSQEEKRKDILLIFGADWCRFCQIADNHLKNDDRLIKTSKKYTIIKIDYDKEKEISKIHNIHTIPTFIIYSEGKEQKRMIGYKNAERMLQFLQ